MLRCLLVVMRPVSVRQYAGPGPWPELADADDLPIWQTAVVAGAQYVVSQNVRHLPPVVQGHHVHGGVEYVTAVEFIEDVLGERRSGVRPTAANGICSPQRAPGLTDWPHSQEVIDEIFTGVPEGERARMLSGNAAEFFRLR